jgi:cob(I)alamin adenosyltransferase
MSIATTHGDTGQTSLIGGHRVSKATRRVEACGTLDELVSQMGFARSLCGHADTGALLKDLQRQLFLVSEEIASGDGSSATALVTAAHVDALTAHVHRLEAESSAVLDWTLPGEDPAGAALDVARTVCRRAERVVVSLADVGELAPSHVVPYLNRLSDLLWLLGRVVEHAAGVDARLRDPHAAGPRWSRAW